MNKVGAEQIGADSLISIISNRLIDAALDSLLQNFKATLRISLVPFLLASVAFFALNFDNILEAAGPTGPVEFDLWGLFRTFLGVFLFVFASFHVAVHWHRFRAGKSGAPARRSAAYMLKSIALTLGLLLLTMVISGLLSILLGLGGVLHVEIGAFSTAYALGWRYVVLNMVGTFLFSGLFLYWSTWLVATALGETSTYRFSQADALTREIFHVALLYTVATMLWPFVASAPLPEILQFVLLVISYWLAFMMSIAVLTEIYELTKMREPVAAQPAATAAEDPADTETLDK